MLLHNFQAGPSWSRFAAAQQLCLLRAIYKDRRDGAASLVGTNARIRAWHQIANFSWPPSWAVIEQHPWYFVAIAGTTNLRQMLGHMRGAFAMIQGPGPLPSVEDNRPRGAPNGAWEALRPALWSDIKQHLPSNLSGVKVLISGHSYGAAMAQMLASTLLAETPGADVELMTFGQPRVWTRGYRGPVPQVCYLFCSQWDPVFVSPPDVHLVWLGNIGTDASLGGVDWIEWRHVGHCVYLNADGATELEGPERTWSFRVGWKLGGSVHDLFRTPPYRDGWPVARYPGSALVSWGPQSEHFLDNYLGRVMQVYYRDQENAAHG